MPARIEVLLEDLAQQVREGLLAFSVAIGFQVMERMMTEEVTALVGPKGKHQPGRTAFRHGQENGQVVLGGRKIAVKRPRVRSTDDQEVPLESYQRYQDPSLLGAAALERMLHGLACRRYGHALEPVGESMEPIGTGAGGAGAAPAERSAVSGADARRD